MRTLFSLCVLLAALCFMAGVIFWQSSTIAEEDPGQPQPPKVGETAPDFSLKTLDGAEARLSTALASGPTAVVFLRGYPGYQCPICTRQVGRLVAARDEFAERNANVILIYPGPAERLTQRAQAFQKDFQLPSNFALATDPDYEVTNAYRLRWDAPRETAYPSTFVVGTDGKIDYAVVSRSHGGRADTRKVIAAIE